STKSGIGSVLGQGHEQVSAAHTGALGTLDNLQDASGGRAEAMLAEGQAAVDAGLAGGLAAHATIAGQAGQMLDVAGRGAITTVAEAGARSQSAPPVVARQASGAATNPASTADAPDVDEAALAQLDQVGSGLDASANSQQQDAATSLRQAGVGAQQAG